MEKKAVFFDIDGTIVSDDEKHVIISSVKEAVEKLRANGIYTIINTGRTRFNVDKNILDLGFDGIVSGCGTYIEFQKKVLFYHGLEKSLQDEMVQLVRECKASPIYEHKDNFYFDVQTKDMGGTLYLKDIYRKQGKNVTNTVESEDFIFDKFCIWFDDNTDLVKFKEGILGKFDYIDRGSDFAEMQPCGCSKGRGIEIMLEKLGVKKENSYGIGDSMNDLPMMETVGNRIIIGENSPLLKFGGYKAGEYYDDALYKGVQHFGLI